MGQAGATGGRYGRYGQGLRVGSGEWGRRALRADATGAMGRAYGWGAANGAGGRYGRGLRWGDGQALGVGRGDAAVFEVGDVLLV